MASHNFNSVAEELQELLSAIPEAPKKTQVDESYTIAVDPIPTPEQTAIDENKELLPELIRSIVEHAITRAPTHATPNQLGEAIGEGVSAAIEHLCLDDLAVVEAVDVFLHELDRAVRSRLSME